MIIYKLQSPMMYRELTENFTGVRFCRQSAPAWGLEDKTTCYIEGMKDRREQEDVQGGRSALECFVVMMQRDALMPGSHQHEHEPISQELKSERGS